MQPDNGGGLVALMQRFRATMPEFAKDENRIGGGRIDGGAVLIFSYLATRIDPKTNAWFVSQARIAADIGLSEKAVFKGVERLRKMFLLTAEATPPHGTYKYTLHFRNPVGSTPGTTVAARRTMALASGTTETESAQNLKVRDTHRTLGYSTNRTVTNPNKYVRKSNENEPAAQVLCVDAIDFSGLASVSRTP